MSAKRNHGTYIGATVCKGVRRGKGFKVREVGCPGLFDFVMLYFRDDVEKMRLNEWSDDEENI